MLTVNDLQDERFSLVQAVHEIQQFNEEYQEEYSYYFIEFERGWAKTLYGSHSSRLDARVYKVSDL